VPVQKIGKLVLNRNPDNFFAETEQVAFHPGHVVPGIDFSNDPLLQGGCSRTPTRSCRAWAAPNFHELPINRPCARCTTSSATACTARPSPRPGEPTSPTRWATAPSSGSTAARRASSLSRGQLEPPKIRRRSPSFDDHFSQATLFWNSQSAAEKDHIVAAFRSSCRRWRRRRSASAWWTTWRTWT
jgi:catalase